MKYLPGNGIVARSILITLLAFLVAGVGALTYTSFATAKRASQTIDTRLNQLLDTVQSTVKIACFLKDHDLAKEVAVGLLSNSEILRVMIVVDAETLADESKTVAFSQPTASTFPLKALERKIHSPFTAGKIVGEVRLEPNPEVIATQRRDDILLAVEQLAWQLLLVSAAIGTALIYFLVRPISRMSLALHKMDPTTGDRLFIPPGHERTEIGNLVRDVNQLSDHLVSALNEAREARLAAESASDAKSHFLANMSHEIRTPLTAVQGFARIGARDSRDPVSREMFSRILDAGTHLLGVINDILDFSKIEAGKLVIDSQPVRIADIATEVLALMQARAEEKGLELNYRPSPDLPAWMMGDPMRIRQILVNLVSNAIKFSRHGSVDLIVLRADDEIWFAIRDEGIGMTEEEISRLFRPFEQADTTTTRRYGGTGLGLSISMNLASLMGGTIQVVSTPWRGSTFTLQLPLKEATLPPTGETGPETQYSLTGKLAGYQILVAEDIEANRLVLADLLDEAGADYVFVDNGRAALEQVIGRPTGFDVVLMDVQMPEMDGNEATRRILEISPDLPVIGLTAHGLSQDRSACLAAGMKDHITKPLDPKTLFGAILRWARPARSRPGQTPVRAAPTAASTTRQTALPGDHSGSGEVDWSLLHTRFKGRQGYIQTIIRSTLTGHADTASRLRRHAKAADFDALALLAHDLKGVFGNLAAASTQDLAVALEAAARKHDDSCLRLAKELADRVEALFSELERYLVGQ